MAPKEGKGDYIISFAVPNVPKKAQIDYWRLFLACRGPRVDKSSKNGSHRALFRINRTIIGTYVHLLALCMAHRITGSPEGSLENLL